MTIRKFIKKLFVTIIMIGIVLAAVLKVGYILICKVIVMIIFAVLAIRYWVGEDIRKAEEEKRGTWLFTLGFIGLTVLTMLAANIPGQVQRDQYLYLTKEHTEQLEKVLLREATADSERCIQWYEKQMLGIRNNKALGNHELDYIGTAEGKKMQKHPENSELVKDLTDAGACVLEEGYRDVEIGGCKVRIGGMYEYAFALDGDNSAENLTGNVRDFLEEFQNTDRYKIMLCHRPDSFVFGDASDYWKIDLVISGHDHGGQVVIPFKGGLYGGDQGWFPPYVHGLYRTGRIRLFVTSGLSSEKQKLPRWNNRPEIAVLNVH